MILLTTVPLLLSLIGQSAAVDGPNAAGNCSRSDCPWKLYSHYTERNCKPIFEEGKCCPQRFDCMPLELNSTHCLYGDKIFPAGDKIDVSSVCQKCRCSSGFDNSSARISCASVECPSVFGRLPTPEKGCAYIREEGRCCRVLKCENETDAVNVTCTYNGVTYQQGDEIDLGKDGNPCRVCYCQAGFNGSTDGPWCKDFHCNFVSSISSIKRNCAPIYRSDLCCAYEWHCHPDGNVWQTHQEICLNPLDTGLSFCNDYKIHYYYDMTLGRCEKFNYTGCVGNLNNFATLKACERVCEKPGLCSLPPTRDSDCNGTESTKYYYDTHTSKCLQFQYKGCPANGNIFQTEEQCLGKCGVQLQDRSNLNIDICQMDSDRGPCDEAIPRYFYNPVAKQCENFTYGGCKGNGNNFETEEDCQQSCKKETEDTDSSNKCNFGNYKFPLGHTLPSEKSCRNCTCITPPLFTCVEEGCPK